MSVRFQGSEGKVIGRHIVSDVRKFVECDAYVRNLGEAISIGTAARGLKLAILLVNLKSSSKR